MVRINTEHTTSSNGGSSSTAKVFYTTHFIMVPCIKINFNENIYYYRTFWQFYMLWLCIQATEFSHSHTHLHAHYSHLHRLVCLAFASLCFALPFHPINVRRASASVWVCVCSSIFIPVTFSVSLSLSSSCACDRASALEVSLFYK